MNQLRLPPVVTDQLLRLGIFFLVCAQVVVIGEAILLMTRGPSSLPLEISSNWSDKLGTSESLYRSGRSAHLATLASKAQEKLAAGDFKSAEGLYETLSADLGRVLGLNVYGTDSAIAADLIRRRLKAKQDLSESYFDTSAYLVEARVLFELADIYCKNGKDDKAFSCLTKAATIYADLEVDTPDRLVCLAELKKINSRMGNNAGTDVLSADLANFKI